MLNTSNINTGDAISWFLDAAKKSVMTGVVVERVRAKSRPKYEGDLTKGQPTRREVSFIVKVGNKPLWIGVNQLVENKKPDEVKVIQVVSLPKRVIAKIPMPAAFRQDFSSLLKYLPQDRRGLPTEQRS